MNNRMIVLCALCSAVFCQDLAAMTRHCVMANVQEVPSCTPLITPVGYHWIQTDSGRCIIKKDPVLPTETRESISKDSGLEEELIQKLPHCDREHSRHILQEILSTKFNERDKKHIKILLSQGVNLEAILAAFKDITMEQIIEFKKEME